MSEIYWLTRLDALVCIFTAVAILSLVAFLSLLIMVVVDGEDEDLLPKSVRRKSMCISLIALVISTIVAVFIPSSKEAMMIWGIGTTIDYIQENEAIKQLPDKCVKALEEWVDSLTEEE